MHRSYRIDILLTAFLGFSYSIDTLLSQKDILSVTRLLPTCSMTWRSKLLVTQKYQGEVVYQEEAAPVLMKAVVFINTLAHPLML
jgi:hypothetical protein